LTKNGPGLVIYTGNTMSGDTHITEGTLRFATDLDYSTNVVRIYGGGVFELGADLNAATAGDFTKPLANSVNGVVLVGDGGFSAHNADRTVSIGSGAALTWGSGFFLADPTAGTTDNDYIFKLGSATSTHTLEFQNAINLGVRQRVIEVADGTSSTNVDARLTGVLSGTNGRLLKIGTGTLQLTGINTYTGSTTIRAGALQVGQGGIGRTGTGAVNVENGGTLLGTGLIAGSSFSAGSGSKIHAGDTTAVSSYGTLTFTPGSGSGTFNFQNGSSVILGIHADGTSDLLNFVGTGTNTLLFNGSLTVGPSTLTPTTEKIFNLLDWSGLTSAPTFASHFSYTGLLYGNEDEASGLDLPDIYGSGYAWDISQFTTNGSISLIIPEPGRALLLLGGLTGLLMRRRRI